VTLLPADQDEDEDQVETHDPEEALALFRDFVSGLSWEPGQLLPQVLKGDN
jgi:hypothetical protein